MRSTKTKGELNSLRSKGIVPGIVYGGKEQNQKISLSKKEIKYFIIAFHSKIHIVANLTIQKSKGKPN